MIAYSLSVPRTTKKRARAYLEVHPAQLLAPFDEEGEADVEVEFGEGVASFSLRACEQGRRERRRDERGRCPTS